MGYIDIFYLLCADVNRFSGFTTEVAGILKRVEGRYVGNQVLCLLPFAKKPAQTKITLRSGGAPSHRIPAQRQAVGIASHPQIKNTP